MSARLGGADDGGGEGGDDDGTGGGGMKCAVSVRWHRRGLKSTKCRCCSAILARSASRYVRWVAVLHPGGGGDGSGGTGSGGGGVVVVGGGGGVESESSALENVTVGCAALDCEAALAAFPSPRTSGRSACS